MKKNVLKLSSCLALSLSLSTAIYADLEDRLEVLEKEMQEISARNPQQTLGASFYTARPEVKAGNWFVTFDLTYWHTKMGGTEYAYSFNGFNNTQGMPAFPIDGDVKEHDFGWDIGVKAGLGYKTPHDKWDLYARYTYYETDDTSSSFKAAPSGLISLTFILPVTASKAKSTIEVSYNNVELELARSYFVSSKLSFRPHFDVKSAWIDIDQDVVYTASGINTFFDGLGGLDYKTKGRINFWGLGPRTGIDSKWYLGYGFHVFADFAASILYGKFSSLQRDFIPPSLNPDQFPNGRAFKVRSQFHRFVPFGQMFLGLGYQQYINNSKQHLGIKAGYEVQYYWRVNQIHQPEDLIIGNVSTVDQGGRIQFEKQTEDLMFYGITGEIRLDF
jgi:hypothetical protein